MQIENVIYGDVLMIINFSMDFLSLYLTGRILSLKGKTYRLSLSALLGAGYSLGALFLPSGVTGAVIAFSFALLMCLVAFGKGNVIRPALVFSAVNFLIGGGITASSSLFGLWRNSKRVSIGGKAGVVYGELPLGALVVGAAVCAVAAFLTGRAYKKRVSRAEGRIKIVVCGREKTLRGLVDTGCSLSDPLSGRGVVVFTYPSLRGVLPTECLRLFDKSGAIPSFADGKACIPLKLRLVPYESLGKRALLPAFLPDSLEIDGKLTDMLAAVDASASDFNGYDALIPFENL